MIPAILTACIPLPPADAWGCAGDGENWIKFNDGGNYWMRVSIGDGFKFGLGFTLGSAVASFIILPILACIGFVAMSLLGGGLAGLLRAFGQ
jgi:hypothetical protein